MDPEHPSQQQQLGGGSDNVEHRPHDGDGDDDAAAIDLADVEEVVQDGDDGDVPMDEDDEDDEGNDQVGEMSGGGHSAADGQAQQQGQTTFEDSSIAAFYSHRKSLFTVALHPQYPNPPLAISGGEDDGGWIWETREGNDVVRLGGHEDSVTAVGFNAAGDMAATGGMDGKVRVWRRVKRSEDDWSTWEFLTSVEGPDEIVWMQWHPQGNVIIAGASDTTVWMWNLPKGDVMQVFSGHTAAVTAGSFTPDGKRIVSVSEDGSLIVWDPRSGEAQAKLQPHDARFAIEGGITSLAVSPDGKLAVVGGASGDVRVVGIAGSANGTIGVVATLIGHAEGESVEAASFIDLLGRGTGGMAAAQAAHASTAPPPNSASATVITASTEGKAIVWDLSTSKPRCEVLHDAAITGLSVHRGTPLFTTSSADHTLCTWDARTGANVATHKGFTDGVLALAVGPDDGYTQGAETGGLGAYVDPSKPTRGWKIVGAGDEGVALVFRV